MENKQESRALYCTLRGDMVIKIQASRFAKKGTGGSRRGAGFLHGFALWPHANVGKSHFSVFKINSTAYLNAGFFSVTRGHPVLCVHALTNSVINPNGALVTNFQG